MAIKIHNLTKEYKRGAAVFRAVDNASLTIEKGDFINIIGRSGSGKTTLLNLIAGLLAPSSGSIEADNQDIAALDDRAVSAYRNTKIGYIPQGASILGNLTVLDNVRLPYYLQHRTGSSQERALSLLKQTGIGHLADAYPRHLSGGELKRVAIARALINQPDYILADEPTGDLDAKTTAEIMQLFRQIAENGTAVLMVTHELDVLEYGNRTFVMDSGVLTEQTNKTIFRAEKSAAYG